MRHLLTTKEFNKEELLALIPGPDYPGGGQIISSSSDIADAYRTGRGSLRLRARGCRRRPVRPVACCPRRRAAHPPAAGAAAAASGAMTKPVVSRLSGCSS